jgi:isoquinoline 1-oxidoreductase beta subunit
MVYAVIERSPVFGGRPASVDDRRARAVAGVLDVVVVDADIVGAMPPNNPRVAHGIAVIADSTWTAIRGRDALMVSWEAGPAENESSDGFWRECEQLATRARSTSRRSARCPSGHPSVV